MPTGMHFLNVPRELLDDLGRIAVVAGRIEESAYNFAGVLGMPQPQRAPNFTRLCDDVRSRLADPWCPAAFKLVREGSWVQEVSEWTKVAPPAMDEYRNKVMHRQYFSRLVDQGQWETAYHPDRRDRFVSEALTPLELSTAIDALLEVSDAGAKLWIEWTMLVQRPWVPPAARRQTQESAT